jgi:hypothetical protein
MEKANNPVTDYNSDHSDIGSEIYSHDESDIVNNFVKLQKENQANICLDLTKVSGQP